MNMGVCLGVCEIIEHDNLANNQSIMILYSILQGYHFDKISSRHGFIPVGITSTSAALNFTFSAAFWGYKNGSLIAPVFLFF